MNTFKTIYNLIIKTFNHSAVIHLQFRPLHGKSVEKYLISLILKYLVRKANKNSSISQIHHENV